MRKAIHFFLVCLIANITAVTNVNAQSKLIHYWDFNGVTSMTSTFTPTIAALPADYSDLPSANARILYTELPGTSAAYASSLDQGYPVTADDTINQRLGATGGDYIRTRNPSDSMELLFYIPSTHFNNLVFTFSTSRPVNGAVHQNYDYSADSGVTWINTGLSLVTDSVWSVFQRITLTTSNPAVNNNSKLVFRITWTGSTTGGSGNNRFDNVSLDGDTILTTSGVHNTISEPSEYILYPNPVVNTLDISAAAEGIKHIIITNSAGQKLYEATENGHHFSISTTNLKAGYYLVSIIENTSGKESSMQFIKK